MRGFGLLFIAAAISAPAHADTSPVYLACELKQDTGMLPVEVALDESNQRAIVALPTTGRTVTRPALFSPNEVTVRDGDQTWIIDRVTLDFRRTFSFEPSTDPGEHGLCKIKPKPPVRAF